MDSVLCPRCGASTAPGTARCPSCATPLESAKPAVGLTPTNTRPDQTEPTTPTAAESLADSNRTWLPPGARPQPATTDRDRGLGTPGPHRRSRRPVLLAGVGVLVVVAVLVGVFVTGRSQPHPPPTLRMPDTLGGLPRDPSPVPLPPIEGGRLATEVYGSGDGRQTATLIAMLPGVGQTPEEIASFYAQSPIDGSPGTFRESSRDGLDIRCADLKGLEGQLVAAVCYLDRPDVQVVVHGAPPAPIPDLVAEAYHKLTG